MARLLVIEDEPLIADVLRTGLQVEGHAVDVVHDGVAGLRAAKHGRHDLVLLDLLLPGLPGLTVCRRVRAAGVNVPILMLTGLDTTADVVAGLDAGADDYLTKPFTLDILVGRVGALLRRRASGATGPRYRVGPLELDTAAHRAWRDGAEVLLTAKEYEVLEALVRRRGLVLSKSRIAHSLWHRAALPEPSALDALIASLRRKIDRHRSPRLIHAVGGVGYVVRLEDE